MPDAIACCMKLYADDAKIYNRVNNRVQSRRLQGCVINAKEWAHEWDMFFNFGKCKHVNHGSHDDNFRYLMRNNDEIKEIQNVTSEKNLGVIVNNKLLFREHITKKFGIANRNLCLIFKTLWIRTWFSACTNRLSGHILNTPQ